MQSLLELLKKSEEFLAKKGIENARLQSELLFAGTLQCRRLDLYLQFDKPIPEAQIATLRERILRRSRREPLQYILGDTDFRELTLKCDPRALIPRPETEELVGYALERLEKQIPAGTHADILDLGTGTGAIALSFAKERSNSKIVAADKSDVALALAQENALATGLQDAVSFVQSDWFSAITGTFDLIISNPPYLTQTEWECAQSEVREHEPLSALVAENAGIADLEKILSCAKTYLNPKGFVALETGIAQHEQLQKIAYAAGFKTIESLQDLSGRPRFFFAYL